MIVADTDVLIDFLSNRGPAVTAVRAEMAAGRLVTTAITRFELMAGARGTKSVQRVADLLDAMQVLPLDVVAADEAASVRKELESAGSPIGMADSLIAGIVRLHGHCLLTRNLRHFERVKGLSLYQH